MGFLKDILSELQQEGAVTRNFLEQVDFEYSDFRPHKKSEKLGRLAIHIAEIIAWWKNVLENAELDFMGFEPKEIQSKAELLDYFDMLLLSAENAIKSADEAELTKEWSMKYGDNILFTLQKKEVLRKFCLNHLIHHRAQLGVYLRILNLPLPATYGPSADDNTVVLVKKFL